MLTVTLSIISKARLVCLNARGTRLKIIAAIMICVNNVVSACATTGTLGNEGKIIKTNALPCLI